MWGGGGEKTIAVSAGGSAAAAAGAGGGTQGLAHWMSVMAEHMNQETAALQPTYVWNGTEVH